MKKPASATHPTLAFSGRRHLNLSQFKMVAKPPADIPDRIACHYISRDLANKILLQFFFRKALKVQYILTFSALSNPLLHKSSIIALNILAPLKYNLFS